MTQFLRLVGACDHNLPEHLSGGCPVCIAGQLALALEKLAELETKLLTLMDEIEAKKEKEASNDYAD